jgi:hypothetical protein
MNTMGPTSCLSVVSRSIRTLVLVQDRVEVHAASLADQVGVICGWRYGNSFDEQIEIVA